MIKLIVDSTCDMPRAVIEKYDIAVLPLQVVIDDRSFQDGVDITAEQLYAEMRRGIMPKTSQINFAQAEELFRDVCKQGNDFIYLSFSSGMSGTYQAAKLIIGELQEEFPQCKINAVDSEGGCFATGLIAMQTARWIAENLAYAEVMSLLKEMIPKVQHLFTLDSLNWLAKGGRIIRPAGIIGDTLNFKPILDVENTTMHIKKIVRGRKKTLETLIQMLVEKSKQFPQQLFGITHADDPNAAKMVNDMLLAIIPQAKTLILPIGCVLASHLGIGGVGLFFFGEPVRGYDLLSESCI